MAHTTKNSPAGHRQGCFIWSHPDHADHRPAAMAAQRAARAALTPPARPPATDTPDEAQEAAWHRLRRAESGDPMPRRLEGDRGATLRAGFGQLRGKICPKWRRVGAAGTKAWHVPNVPTCSHLFPTKSKKVGTGSTPCAFRLCRLTFPLFPPPQGEFTRPQRAKLWGS